VSTSKKANDERAWTDRIYSPTHDKQMLAAVEYCDAVIVASTTGYYSVSMRRTDPISFPVKAEIKQTLERLAKEDRRSLSSHIELALEEHIEAKMRSGGGKKGKR
jgi:hypothetical protein